MSSAFPVFQLSGLGPGGVQERRDLVQSALGETGEL